MSVSERTISNVDGDGDGSLTGLAIPDGLLLPEEILDPFCSRLGGYPVFLGPCEAASQSPRCGMCQSILYFILQLDCSSSGRDKVLYVFGCNSARCSGHQRAWHIFYQTRSATVAPSSCKTAKNFWEEGFQNLSLSSCPVSGNGLAVPSYPQPSYTHRFPATALRIVTEMWAESSSSKAAPIKIEMDTSAGDADVYEKLLPTGVDKSFEKFQKRVSAYPRQCVRIDGSLLPFNGSALPPTPPCPQCGSASQFVLQLMPAILNYLPVGQGQYLQHIHPESRGNHPLFGDEMQWGSVFVYGCPRDHLHCHIQQEN